MQLRPQYVQKTFIFQGSDKNKPDKAWDYSWYIFFLTMEDAALGKVGEDQ